MEKRIGSGFKEDHRVLCKSLETLGLIEVVENELEEQAMVDAVWPFSIHFMTQFSNLTNEHGLWGHLQNMERCSAADFMREVLSFIGVLETRINENKPIDGVRFPILPLKAIVIPKNPKQAKVVTFIPKVELAEEIGDGDDEEKESDSGLTLVHGAEEDIYVEEDVRGGIFDRGDDFDKEIKNVDLPSDAEDPPIPESRPSVINAGDAIFSHQKKMNRALGDLFHLLIQVVVMEGRCSSEIDIDDEVFRIIGEWSGTHRAGVAETEMWVRICFGMAGMAQIGERLYSRSRTFVDKKIAQGLPQTRNYNPNKCHGTTRMTLFISFPFYLFLYLFVSYSSQT